ncbi:hypothetical protein GCM10027589_25000 [Actinocorallia lasiicapitis]
MNVHRPPTLIGRILLGIALVAAALTAPAPQAHAEPSPTYRAAYHLTVPDNWKNDPQRPIFINGEYQYYYLYNRDYLRGPGTEWRRSTTTDNVNFTDRGVSIPKFTQPNGDVWSGSAVVDEANTAGFGANAVVAVMTQRDSSNGAQAQFLWYSTDGGKTFAHYSDTPVLPNPGKPDFRDPKIVRDTARNRWVMALAEGRDVGFYTSTDLKHWQFQSSYGTSGIDIVECPDLFPLKADDGTTKWVLGVSANGKASGLPNTYAYWTGGFNGTTFQADEATPQWLDHGWDWYAAVTWEKMAGGSPDPAVRYGLGWMNNWSYPEATPTWPNDGFNGTDSIVREIRLKKQAGGSFSLVSQPVSGLDGIVNRTVDLGTLSVDGQTPLSYSGSAYELSADVSWETATDLGVRLRTSADGNRHADVGVTGGNVYVDRAKTGNPDGSGRYLRSTSPISKKNVHLRILVDRTTLEVFVDDGKYVHSSEIFPAPGDKGIALFSQGGPAQFSNVKIREFKDIYGTAPADGGTNPGSNVAGPWRAVGGSWTSVADGKTGTAPGDAFYMSAQTGSDLSYEGDLRLDTAIAAGITFRASNDLTKHYTANINTDGGGQIKLWKPGMTLGTFSTPIVRGQNYHLKVVAAGSRIKVFLNNGANPVIDVTDTSYASGLSGINLYNGAATIRNANAGPVGTDPEPSPGFTTNLTGPWTSVAGTWTDTAAGEKGSATGDGYYLSSQTASDFTYEADLRPDTAGNPGTAAGLTFRSNATATAHYTVNINTTGEVKLWRPWTTLGTYNTAINPGTAYHLKVVATGPRIKIYFNNGTNPVIDVTDTTYTTGRLGLNIWNGTTTTQNATIS